MLQNPEQSLFPCLVLKFIWRRTCSTASPKVLKAVGLVPSPPARTRAKRQLAEQAGTVDVRCEEMEEGLFLLDVVCTERSGTTMPKVMSFLCPVPLTP